MKYKIRAVFFDYDGTLIDSIPEIYRGVCRVLERCGRPPVTFGEFQRTFKSPYMEWYTSRGVTISREEITSIYFNNMKSDESPYLPRVELAVSKLRNLGFHLGIVSAHYEDRIRERVIAKDRLFHEKEHIVGLSHRKAADIRKLCEAHDLKPYQVVYVGDLASDVRDAREAGVISAAYVGPRGLREAFVDHEPDIYLEKELHELLDHVEHELTPR